MSITLPSRPLARPLAAAVVAMITGLAVPAGPVTAAPPGHPLDPLTREEVAAAAGALRRDERFPAGGRFALLALREPPKTEVLAWSAGPFRREASAVIYDRAGRRTFEAAVDVPGRRVLSWREVPGVQPVVLEDEGDLLDGIVRADERWQAAVRARGLEPDDVHIDYWAVGVPPSSAPPGHRLLRALCYLKGDDVNFYARPLEGIEAVVDMTDERVLEMADHAAGVPPAMTGDELDEAAIRDRYGLRTAPRPLLLTQPAGPSFELAGQEVRWQKWRFRWSLHPREGLVLHRIGYEDGGRVRPILYRASLSEMVVPYGDPRPGWRWRAAFDVGEYGIGKSANPLRLGVEVPENAVLLDAVLADDDGRPRPREGVVALYERDGGLLWKHAEPAQGYDHARRGRELVIVAISTIGNYDYGVSWIFKQDGSLEVEAGLTGIMLPQGVPPGAEPRWGHLVAPGVAAPHHQHILSFRLDFDVEGTANRVLEMDTAADPPGPDNPLGNAFSMRETTLASELAARRSMAMDRARAWRVAGPRTAGAHEPGYILAPGPNALPFVAASNPARQRGGFMDHHLWVTRFEPSELYAAGDYPNQSTRGEGLPRWVERDAPLVGQDVVVWYTLNVTHIPRPEEWPVMSTGRFGFKLLPAGFFERNPALDVPR